MSETQTIPARRTRRGRRGRATENDNRQSTILPVFSMGSLCGGNFKPLVDDDCETLTQAALSILNNVGMSEAPETVIKLVEKAGGKAQGGRLYFPSELVRQAISGVKRNFTLCGQIPDHDIHMSGKSVSVGTGGAAPMIVDMETAEYRPSTLLDLYDAARLTDSLQHIHFFSRSMVARDMPDDKLLDLNTAFANLGGTLNTC